MQKLTAVILIVYLLTACETTAVKSIGNIKTENTLKNNIPLPVELDIGYYADFKDLHQIQVVRFYDKIRYLYPGDGFQKALDLVMPGHFKNAEQLSLGSDINYLFIFKSEADTNLDGKYTVSLNTRIVNTKGEQRFEVDTVGSSSGGVVFDKNAYQNAYATALKEAIILFLNSFNDNNFSINALNNNLNEVIDSPKKVRTVLGDIEPTESGTGFFVNKNGDIVTAAHVINDCMFIEAKKNGQDIPIELVDQSKVIDLALLHSSIENPEFASIGKNATASLGMQVFTTGYPLSGILMDNPSLTQGSVSSLSGIKGSIGEFSFTAPTQPGNSGGPVVSFNGNVIGVVDSTINQSEFMRKTGNSTQNLNFGIGAELLAKFLDKNDIEYSLLAPKTFEESSKSSVDYSTQILCYR